MSRRVLTGSMVEHPTIEKDRLDPQHTQPMYRRCIRYGANSLTLSPS